MRRLCNSGDLFHYIKQEGTTTEIGGNVYIDGKLTAQGVEQHEFLNKYHIGSLSLRETLTNTGGVAVHYTITFANISFYSDTNLTSENFNGNYKNMLLALQPVGVATFQQIVNGSSSVTIHGIATITQDGILCFYLNQGSVTGALYDFDEHLELLSVDMLNLSTGEGLNV